MPEEVWQGIYRIPVPLPNNPLKELNSYLIKGKDRSLLIDTGFRQEACRQALQAGLEELEVCREETDILLTHLHSDHAGLAGEFIAPGRSIYINAGEQARMEASAKGETWKNSDARYLEEGMNPQQLEELHSTNPARALAPLPQFEQYVPLAPGQVLEVGGHKLVAVLTGGHTPGHTSLWLPEEEVMFTGDNVLFDITPNITAWKGVEDSLGDYLATLQSMRDYKVKRALPGHRKSGVFAQRVEELLSHHQARLEEARNIVKRNGGMTAYQITAQMTWKIKASSWETFPLVQKWFAIGECFSHLDRLRVLGEARRELGEDGLYHYYAG
jgi:glyoxylase-like metal-dependent hydrolase (beta-lactamase superfamily II)